METIEYKHENRFVFRACFRHPYLSMTLERNEEGDVFAVRSEEIMAEITEGKSLPDAESLIRPFDLPAVSL